MRERDIEAYLVKRVKELGGEVRKVRWIGLMSGTLIRIFAFLLVVAILAYQFHQQHQCNARGGVLVIGLFKFECAQQVNQK